MAHLGDLPVKLVGVWHKTSVEAAREQQTSYKTSFVTGQKRSSSTDDPPPSSQKRRLPQHQQQPIKVLLNEFPRLAASSIEQTKQKEESPSEYSQRRAFPSTPTPTLDPLLSLSNSAYSLPPQLVANFAASGIKSIYPWQKQCLLGPGLLQGDKNLVYSAPTGGGKSLVADILMLKRVLSDREAKALLVLPYIALVQEKVRWLRNIVSGITRESLGQKKEDKQGLWASRADRDTIRVVGFYGGNKVRATWADFDIAVCTIEKANALVNGAITDCTVSKLQSVVLDECHMIDDGNRGYLLELLTTKLLCLGQSIQIVAMSATLTNIDLLKNWLQGHSYETHYRPIPIEEHLVYEGKIYAADTTASLLKTKTVTSLDSRTQAQPTQSGLEPLRIIKPSSHKELKDAVLNAVVALANETARAGFGVLVFSSSRAATESDAVIISRVLPSFLEAPPAIQEKRLDLLNDLRSLATGLDPNLEKTIPSGVAFHHAGLTTEERELVANAYDAGVLKVCVATCSLAAGINLPASRVILHGARMGRDLVGPAMLRQMRGRAGRKGKDEVGETYLCCRQSDLEAVVDLMHADLPEISSCLISDQRRTQRALLETITIKLATSREALDDFVSKTMLAYSTEAEPGSIQKHVEASLENLESMQFITVDDGSTFQATLLGSAVVASSLDPDDGIFIHNELRTALKAFVMDGDMHQLDESGMRVLDLIGLKPFMINKMLHSGALKQSTPEEKDTARRYYRFYLALQLRDLCNEIPIHRVAQKYDTPRGMVQTIAQSSQGFALGMVNAMAVALDYFSDRLKAGAKSDLLALARITSIKSRTARVFWDNGFKTVASIANADPKELLPILMQAQPNKVKLGGEKDEEKYMEKLLGKAKVIADSANRLWQIEMQQDLDEE
ncbi:DNA polymerase theta [Podospora fimiseda]|uniref:DNA polymerase theta n=1 Tax=Podospora fimiseda TaxID=252190 RepID=A0AAN7BML0_9PEZI|nr:DNA polymerase theta [Podospora fimiseda]